MDLRDQTMEPRGRDRLRNILRTILKASLTILEPVEELMSCRTGPLRVATPQTKTCLRGPRFARPLRGVYTDLAEMILCGPPVGRDYHFRPAGGPSPLACQDKIKRRANARPTRSGPVRQDTVLQQLRRLPGRSAAGCAPPSSRHNFALGRAERERRSGRHARSRSV